MDNNKLEGRFKNRIRQGLEVINAYDFSLSLSEFLWNYYKKNKFLGSNDRRQLSSIVYQYFRLGNNLNESSKGEKIGVATFLCNQDQNPFNEYLIREFTKLDGNLITENSNKKFGLVKTLYPQFSLNSIFPFTEFLSTMEDKDAFVLSHLSQPKVWIRIRPGKEQMVMNELKELAYEFEFVDFSSLCLSFNKHYKLNDTKSYLAGFFEIQDAGSQMIGNLFQPQENENWWDACAGSGGKSLMLLDAMPKLNIYMTDIRESIIRNSIKRFEKIENDTIKIAVADLNQPNPIDVSPEFFDGIIIDAPCTGSGTWASSPEMLKKVEFKDIQKHQQLQASIISNVLPYLKKGKTLIYITCSVYRQENEDVVKMVCDRFNLKLQSQQMIEGYKIGASTFFIARLTK